MTGLQGGLLGAALGVALAGGASAQALQEAVHATTPASASADSTLKAEFVRTGLYMITGGGANSLLRMSPAGSILIDCKLPGQYRPLMSQVRKLSKLSDLPVRVLLLTDHHAPHAGNSREFLGHGVAIVAQANARRHLGVEPPADASKAPVVTYDRSYTLRMGGVEAQLWHFADAQTDDAAVVYLPDLKTVVIGDLFTTGTPQPDVDAGGSLAGWGQAVAEVLKLDFDMVVPGHGPVVGRAELEALKARLDAMIASGEPPRDRP